MEDNKKGFNVLYLVLGVSTLVVAIIGATFAYFSARETNDTVITGNVAEAGGLVLSVTPVTESTGTNIIPLNLIVDYTDEDLTDEETGEVIYEDDGVTPKKKPKNVDQLASAMAATKKCVDDNGNNVCEVYRIEVTNNKFIMPMSDVKVEVKYVKGEYLPIPDTFLSRSVSLILI